MKSKIIFIGIVLFISCSKQQNIVQVQQSSVDDAQTDPTASLTPLNDLGTNTYKGYAGGLYPNGANMPSGTYADDLLAACNSIVPLDTAGQPTTLPKGKVLFIALGASTARDNMAKLKDKTVGNPLTNPKLSLMRCCESKSGTLTQMGDINSEYWRHVWLLLKNNNASLRQVQLVYVETDDSLLTQAFPGRPIEIKKRIEAALRGMKKKLPNLKIVYVLGRTRCFAGESGTNWNREPSPHYFGWACKWAIEDQINGVPGTEYKGGNAVAPIITWGFYEWAKTTPRTTDGFYWLQSDTRDGLHGTPAGINKLATNFQNFLLADPYASNWYAAP